MAGFLGKYDTLQTLYLDEDEEWWVKFQPVLTGAMRDSLRDRFSEVVSSPDGKTYRVHVPDAHTLENRREQILMAIREWNLTDADGNPLPYDHDWEAELKAGAKPSGLRVSWNRLPFTVQDQIGDKIMDADAGPPPERDARFPDGGDGSDQDAVDEASDDRQGVG